MNIEIIKCHGSGNDFILIDEMKHHYSFTEEERKKLSLVLPNRMNGIGSDGILFVLPSDKAAARMRMFNSDGTEAEMCGNGLRCVARHIIEKTGSSPVKIETDKAVLQVAQVEEIYPGIDTFSVAIEPVSFNVDTLPMDFENSTAVDVSIPELSEEMTFTALSVPNPHIVAMLDSYDEKELYAIGQKANNLPQVFPNGVNVSFVKSLAKNKIFVQTYERGVGLTNACGTAMSASSLVSTILTSNDLHTPIVVMNKGGLVNCLVEKERDEYSIQLRGNGTYVYQAAIEVNIHEGTWKFTRDPVYFQKEIDTYETLKDYAASQS
ncbi:diaminopimelate epimerase [Halobacillus salinarum]|uniref:Diaminopimelate epimerase n=1 Tax=Halobacillus salinarum TaxID=2932257 RepID=A0ABY4EI41_9BACI|nr:diaminopimelate epimerase [Halobacillus salinarum]UOQ43289.1 diaminopimelate epimerase [Halobacillus salinarum]